MHISYRYNDQEFVRELRGAQTIIGRKHEGRSIDLDLSPDPAVSRLHARLRIMADVYWIEDLGSASGTKVNGIEIKGKGGQQLLVGDVIKIGNTVIRVLPPPDQAYRELNPAVTEAQPPAVASTQPEGEANEGFAPGAVLADAERRLSILYNLPVSFGAETNLKSLLQLIIESVVDAVPRAKRGALLMEDPTTRQLALKAHTPIDQAAASTTMAQHALTEMKAIIWPPSTSMQQNSDDQKEQLAASIAEYQIKSAMYAPLVWRGVALGVLCVDGGDDVDAFHEDDLTFLQAMSDYAAMAVGSLQLRVELQTQASAQKNLLKLISPQIAERLMRQRGRLRLGGEFRDATILISDIRGFTNLSATMSPDDVTEMLEDYYEQLVPLVFKHQGMIDKFVGDAILAIFGSPDDDPQQHLHAVQTALEMQDAMQAVNARRAAQDKRIGELGIGIHCGEVIHGLIGSAQRMEFTAIGDTVNRASRYCDGAQAGECLISPAVYEFVWKWIETEPTEVMTKHEGALPAFRVKRIKQNKRADS
jgi:adenylate cyclase